MSFYRMVAQHTTSTAYPGLQYKRYGGVYEIVQINHAVDVCDVLVRDLNSLIVYHIQASICETPQIKTTIWPNKDTNITAEKLGIHFEQTSGWGLNVYVHHEVDGKYVNVECYVGDFVEKVYEIVAIDNDIMVLRRHNMSDMTPTNDYIIVSVTLCRNLDLINEIGLVWKGL